MIARFTRYFAALLALAGALLSTPARAQASDADRAAAQALFDDARKLTAEQRWAEACPKLAESQRLDPSMGTQFYLADCLEHVGRLASAWTNYLEVADAARAAGLGERDRHARARAEALRPRLPRLTVKVPAEAARATGLKVTRDGVALGSTLWATAIPIDPGEHAIEATAPGKKRWSATVRAEEGASIEIGVPELPDDADADAAGPRRSPLPDDPRSDGAGPSRSTLRLAGIITGAAGIAGVAVGAGFGAAAIAKKNASNEDGHCDAANTCDPIGKGLRRESLSAATASTVAFVVGSAAIAGGLVLYLVPPPAPRSSQPGATVSLGFGAGRVSLEGRW
ncbi:MAG: hypothetical protein QM820_64310 [Minicystis sp.]